MNKSAILALVCAAFAGQTLMAQTAEEVTFVEDPAQGYTFNRFQDNWFITAEGGANFYFSKYDAKLGKKKRIAPAASLYVGKWFSPIIGGRIGGNFTQIHAVTNSLQDLGAMPDEVISTGYYKQKLNYFVPTVDVMLNLTNWWCGYRPGRVYNAVFYGGGGVVLPYVPDYKANGERDGWKYGKSIDLTAHVGLINSFNLNKHFALALDLRYAVFAENSHETGANLNNDLQAYLTLTYNFNKTSWTAPVVPVCPPVKNCDAEIAALQAANARIADLERQLKDCLSRPVEVKEVKTAAGPLTTVYYVINGTRLSRVDKKVLGAVAEVIKANPDKKYEITGWADNYTGTAAVNDRIRQARANGVEKCLLSYGVNPSQLIVNTNNENLNDMGDKYVALDRAVTVKVAE
ncbi:MAG: OmpA family protein [Bacteroides sp.]|nr:OmpA family protein [Bacteroidales bacterium]MBD5249551.1 OmpA family protein [Barnesiella sp.]MBD5253146.1 OmpA family protein [Barnesiella sp.]MBD5344629.1 OmpA family protein [Bacteroides sp.]MBD5369007.1 OmpA family protein [Bacteroides sp.]